METRLISKPVVITAKVLGGLWSLAMLKVVFVSGAWGLNMKN
jgi:hypothetical protein